MLEILQANIDQAQDEQVAAMFRTHLEESRSHVHNVEQEGKANAKKTDNSIVDSILLQRAVEVEHHEIGVYENLVLNAKGLRPSGRGRGSAAQPRQRTGGPPDRAVVAGADCERHSKDPVQGAGVMNKVKDVISWSTDLIHGGELRRRGLITELST